jgi:N-acetylglucosamine malate deacetylase 1
MKIDILAIGVHPDDVELSASGTLLHHVQLGYTFGLLDLTRGELGTRGTPAIRKQEAEVAAAILGASFRKTLDLGDGFFENNKETLLPIIAVIRECQPKIVLCNAIDDRHPDHARAAKLCADACFYAGLEKIETYDETGKLQPKWRPQSVFHYIQDKQLTPDFVVDITPFFPKKMEAILAFKSQFYNSEDETANTPISGKDFIDFMEAKARVFGRSINAEFAEGFIHARVVGVDNLFHFR